MVIGIKNLHYRASVMDVMIWIGGAGYVLLYIFMRREYHRSRKVKNYNLNF